MIFTLLYFYFWYEKPTPESLSHIVCGFDITVPIHMGYANAK